MPTTRSHQIHGPRGVTERAIHTLDALHSTGPRRTHAYDVPVVEIMTKQVVCASPELELGALIDLMVRDRLGCVPIVDECGHPLGIVTKLDIVEQLAASLGEKRLVVSDIMMPIAITLDDKATVAQAAALMASEDMHHVMIVADRRLVGIVSTMDLTRWLAATHPPR